MGPTAAPDTHHRAPRATVGACVVVDGTSLGRSYRLFVRRTASELGLGGRVRSIAGHVEIEATGDAEALDALTQRLADAPSPAHVDAVRCSPLDLEGRWPLSGFWLDETAADGVEPLEPPFAEGP